MAYPFSGSIAFNNVSNYIYNNVDIRLLWLDTEQSVSLVRKVIDRMNTITGIYRCDKDDCRLNVFALRELEPRKRRDLLRDAHFYLRPTLVVIDGIAELCPLPTESQGKEDEVVTVLRDHFGGAVERPVLTHKLEQLLGLNPSTAKMRISRALSKGVLLQSGKIITTVDYQDTTPESQPIQDECPF